MIGRKVLISWNTSRQFMMKRYCWGQQKSIKKRPGHTARSTEMLALSLAHCSVNSLQGPLPQRGVQGCMEINQQLTSSHNLRSRFNSQDLAGSERKPYFNPQVRKKEKCRSFFFKNGSRLATPDTISWQMVCSGIYQALTRQFTVCTIWNISVTSKQIPDWADKEKGARWDFKGYLWQFRVGSVFQPFPQTARKKCLG